MDTDEIEDMPLAAFRRQHLEVMGYRILLLCVDEINSGHLVE